MPKEDTQFRTGTEQVEIARQGGIASGESRRQKRLMKDTLNTMLELTINDKEVISIDEIKSIAELTGKNITVDEAIQLAQIQKAIHGDTKSAEYIRDTVGQKPTDKLEVTNYDTESVKMMRDYLYGQTATDTAEDS